MLPFKTVNNINVRDESTVMDNSSQFKNRLTIP